jgi:hypothetical protein
MTTPSRIAKGATAALAMLWEEGFFHSWRTANAIDTHLSKIDHHFSPGEIGMALKRARYLTRRGTRGKYEYIQKYPCSADEPPPSKQKGKKVK